MSDRIDVLGTVRNLFSLLWGVLGYVFRFLWLFVLSKTPSCSTIPAAAARADGAVEPGSV